MECRKVQNGTEVGKWAENVKMRKWGRKSDGKWRKIWSRVRDGDGKNDGVGKIKESLKMNGAEKII
jgi:hypothetical protein